MCEWRGFLGSVLMPTEKHGYATAKNIEFCSLLLHQMTALLPKRLAGITNFLLLITIAFLHCHGWFSEKKNVLFLICHHTATGRKIGAYASTITMYLYICIEEHISIWVENFWYSRGSMDCYYCNTSVVRSMWKIEWAKV